MQAALHEQVHAFVRQVPVQGAIAHDAQLGLVGQTPQGVEQQAGSLFGGQAAHIAQQQRRYAALATVARMHMDGLTRRHGRDGVGHHMAVLCAVQLLDEPQQ